MTTYTFDGFQARYLREAISSASTNLQHRIAASDSARYADEAAAFALSAFSRRVRDELSDDLPRLIVSDEIRDQVLARSASLNLSEDERSALSNAVLHRVNIDQVERDAIDRSALDLISDLA